MFSKTNRGAYIEVLKRDLKLLLQTMPHFRVLNKFILSAQLIQLDNILPTSLRVVRHCTKRKVVSTVIWRCDWNICWHAQCGVKLSWSVSNSLTAAAPEKNTLRITDGLLILHWSLSGHTKPPSFILASLNSCKLQIKCTTLIQTEASKSAFSPQANPY